VRVFDLYARFDWLFLHSRPLIGVTRTRSSNQKTRKPIKNAHFCFFFKTFLKKKFLEFCRLFTLRPRWFVDGLFAVCGVFFALFVAILVALLLETYLAGSGTNFHLVLFVFEFFSGKLLLLIF